MPLKAVFTLQTMHYLRSRRVSKRTARHAIDTAKREDLECSDPTYILIGWCAYSKIPVDSHISIAHISRQAHMHNFHSLAHAKIGIQGLSSSIASHDLIKKPCHCDP